MDRMEGASFIAEAITAHWGDRCPEFGADCDTCRTWAVFDGLAAGVKVKELQWVQRIGSDEFFADTSVGRYEVGQVGKFKIATIRMIKEGQWEDDVFAYCFSTEKAKYAAQADYETRIKSALA